MVSFSFAGLCAGFAGQLIGFIVHTDMDGRKNLVHHAAFIRHSKLHDLFRSSSLLQSLHINFQHFHGHIRRKNGIRQGAELAFQGRQARPAEIIVCGSVLLGGQRGDVDFLCLFGQIAGDIPQRFTQKLH